MLTRGILIVMKEKKGKKKYSRLNKRSYDSLRTNHLLHFCMKLIDLMFSLGFIYSFKL